MDSVFMNLTAAWWTVLSAKVGLRTASEPKYQCTRLIYAGLSRSTTWKTFRILESRSIGTPGQRGCLPTRRRTQITGASVLMASVIHRVSSIPRLVAMERQLSSHFLIFTTPTRSFLGRWEAWSLNVTCTSFTSTWNRLVNKLLF